MSIHRTQTRIFVLSLLLAVAVFVASTTKGDSSNTPSKRGVTPGAEPTARMDKWRVLGPGGGGAQFLPTISPHDPNLVLVACDMTGAYITRNAGRSWRMFNLRGRVHFFVFDPTDPQVIYAKATGLWRSSDGGKSWNLIHPDPSSIERVEMGDDHAGETIVFGGEPAGTITALAVDPADSRSLYAVFRNGSSFSLHESKDQGKIWKKSADLSAGGTAIYVDPTSPADDRTLYVAGRRSASVRTSKQWSEGQTPGGVNSFSGISGGFPSKGGKPVFYALAGSSLFVSQNAGATWTQASLPGTGVALQAVATSYHHPETVYISYSRLRLDEGACFGVARSDDYGQSWRLVWKEGRQSAANIHDIWITERFGPGWGENPLNLGVAPDNPELCYGTDYGRTMRTTDGGLNWQAVYSTKVGDGRFTTNGLDVTTCYGVHFDPFDSKRIFITYTDIGLFRSEDGGHSWTGSTAGVPDPWVNTTYWIVFDPEVKGRVWGVMSGVHDLPRPKMWRQRQPSTYDGGICISEDGGKTWKVSGDAQPQMAATHILLDPKSPSRSRILYVAAFGRGVFRSVDGGKSWLLKNNGIEGKEPFAWRLVQDAKGTLYLIVARRSDDGSIGSAMDGALYRSADGAESWQRIPLPAGTNGPNGLAVDPVNPQRLYLAAWGRRVAARQSGGGVFVSEDGGTSWQSLLDRDQHVYDVTMDPRDPKTLYACGFESSAWHSLNGGTSWERIRGYNFKWGHRVIPDPLDRQMIYITTYGGSVWHGPAAGDPSAREDIATPALACR